MYVIYYITLLNHEFPGLRIALDVEFSVQVKPGELVTLPWPSLSTSLSPKFLHL
jgi:hypothetical protein